MRPQNSNFPKKSEKIRKKILKFFSTENPGRNGPGRRISDFGPARPVATLLKTALVAFFMVSAVDFKKI